MSEKGSSSERSTRISIDDPSFTDPVVRSVIQSLLPALKLFGEVLLWVLWIPLAILRILREPIVIALLCILAISWTCIGFVTLTGQITGYDRVSLALYLAFSPLSYFYIPIPAIIDLPATADLQTLQGNLRALSSVVTALQDGINTRDDRCAQGDEPRVDTGAVVERPDYALYTAGGRVLKGLTSPANVDQKQDERTWNLAKPTESLFPWPSGAAMAIHYETHPGYCWPLKGTHGTLGIRLANRVYVEEIAIDNVAAQLAWDRSSTPRRMELWGQVDGPDDLRMVKVWEARHAARIGDAGQLIAEHQRLFKAGKFVRLSSFEYDLSSPSSVQVFPVDQEVYDLPVQFGTVVLVILDNWGKEEYTCLYRLRIYGSLDRDLESGSTKIAT